MKRPDALHYVYASRCMFMLLHDVTTLVYRQRITGASDHGRDVLNLIIRSLGPLVEMGC